MTLRISSSPGERARWTTGGKGVVIDFVVPDVDAAYALLVSRAVEFIEPPTDTLWGHRTATFLDPAGYTLTVTSYLQGGKINSK